MKTTKVIVIVIVIVLVISAGWIFKILFISQSGLGLTKSFVIQDGEGVHQISRELKQDGLIDNSYIFESYVWYCQAGAKILAGEHEIKDNWSVRQLVNALTSGNDLQNEEAIRVIEGWNLNDLSDYFDKNGLIAKADFFKLVGYPAKSNNQIPAEWASQYPFLQAIPPGVSLEGYLFPDTYRIYKIAKPEEIIKKMLDNFQLKAWPQISQGLSAKKMTPNDILTLASILEKEAKTLPDKKAVAGVYYNRLKIGMALQADPTVNYITGKQTDRPSLDDLKSNNLYNTYKYPGLPPGPICNPGLDSIMAAVYPGKSDYLYFINTPDGKLIFAKTLQEHQANRAKYLK